MVVLCLHCERPLKSLHGNINLIFGSEITSALLLVRSTNHVRELQGVRFDPLILFCEVLTFIFKKITIVMASTQIDVEKNSSKDVDDKEWTTDASGALNSWKILTKNNNLSIFSEENEKQYRNPFYFVQGADIQFGFIQEYLEKNVIPGWDKEIELAELAVKKINQLHPKPKFFVMCGDLCHAFPAEQPEIRRAQEIDFKRIFSKLDSDIPLVCVCGNHDVGNQPSRNSILSYRNSFGDDFFSFWCGGIFFIVLNSQYYHDSSLVPEFADEQHEWLQRTLTIAQDSGKRVIVFQHIPWFLKNPDEVDSSYFAIEPKLRKHMLEKFQLAGVQYVFAGHYHRNSGGKYRNIEMVVSSALGGQLGSDQPGLRVVRCFKQDIQHNYYSLNDFPETVELEDCS